ncbi:MAG TPA: hypothetical protein VKG38_03000, partial [Solirubrobacteraceae bacterium]|nr:hypothetical protein [Solirubrobacteraceae bacterium]
MSDTVLLTSELLGSYETRLRSAGVLVDEAPAPRSRTDQDEITRPLGLVLSEEARLWWGWHDGSSGWWRGNCLGFCGDGFTSLERAVKLATELRGVAEEFTEEVDEAGELLDRAWLPFAETRYAIT